MDCRSRSFDQRTICRQATLPSGRRSSKTFRSVESRREPFPCACRAGDPPRIDCGLPAADTSVMLRSCDRLIPDPRPSQDSEEFFWKVPQDFRCSAPVHRSAPRDVVSFETWGEYRIPSTVTLRGPRVADPVVVERRCTSALPPRSWDLPSRTFGDPLQEPCRLFECLQDHLLPFTPSFPALANPSCQSSRIDVLSWVIQRTPLHRSHLRSPLPAADFSVAFG